jgi:hypothetical protein
MKTLQNTMVSLLEIRNLKKRTDIKLFSKVIDKNTFCIVKNISFQYPVNLVF